ncbi:MAG TPA: hypothetical protein VKK79_11565 [Candidatus Lokiarchaeia archaeon]|nr:hypothetical protein [Candidatus Lokiarchaeia archaeon]
MRDQHPRGETREGLGDHPGAMAQVRAAAMGEDPLGIMLVIAPRNATPRVVPWKKQSTC